MFLSKMLIENCYFIDIIRFRYHSFIKCCCKIKLIEEETDRDVKELKSKIIGNNNKSFSKNRTSKTAVFKDFTCYSVLKKLFRVLIVMETAKFYPKVLFMLH